MPAKGQFKLSREQEQEVARRYAANEDSCQIAKEFRIRETTVRAIVRRQGGQVRSISESVRTHTLNEAAFDEVNEESAYWVGFLMGDGCVRHRRYGNTVQLGLASVDTVQVEAFRNFLGSSHPIDTRVAPSSFGDAPRSQITIISNRLVAALAKYGVVPQKTHIARVIGLDSDRHFWRGVIDADGAVFISRTTERVCRPGKVYFYNRAKPILSLAGSRSLMEQYATFLRSHIKTVASVRPHSSIFEVRCCGEAAVKAVRLIYEGCRTALPRKLAAANGIMVEFGNHTYARGKRPTATTTRAVCSC